MVGYGGQCRERQPGFDSRGRESRQREGGGERTPVTRAESGRPSVQSTPSLPPSLVLFPSFTFDTIRS